MASIEGTREVVAHARMLFRIADESTSESGRDGATPSQEQVQPGPWRLFSVVASVRERLALDSPERQMVGHQRLCGRDENMGELPAWPDEMDGWGMYRSCPCAPKSGRTADRGHVGTSAAQTQVPAVGRKRGDDLSCSRSARDHTRSQTAVAYRPRMGYPCHDFLLYPGLDDRRLRGQGSWITRSSPRLARCEAGGSQN